MRRATFVAWPASSAAGGLAGLAGGELLKAVFEDEGVEDRRDGGLVVLGELVDGLELFEQVAVGDLDAGFDVGPVVEGEVVEGDVEKVGGWC
jgi:hypothetical protein